MKKWMTPILVCAAIFVAQAQVQYKTVVFDYEKASFNGGQPLPAGSYLLLQGPVIPEVDIVKVFIFPASSEQLLYQGQWKRSDFSRGNAFQVPIALKLKSDEAYDMQIRYYRATTDPNRAQLKEQLFGFLDAYIDQAVVVEKNRIRLNTPVSKMVKHLDEVVRRGISYYDNRSAIEFPGFSDLVTSTLKHMRNKDITPGNYYEPDSAASKQGRKYNYATDQISTLKELVHSEVSSLLNTDLAGLYDSKTVRGYRTEKVANVLTLNAGYGAVYLDGGVNNLSYGSGFTAGVSFPLGSRIFPSRFFTKTTFSAGIFLNNFKNGESQTLSGPVVGRPVYAGLGYSLADFLRVTAGAVVLQNTGTAPDGISLQAVTVRPYVGLSLDLNLWMGIGGKSSMRKQ
ncbi:MAG: hypothetical protein ICV83_18460 [Cytophagales bacterium]|nr:hypothetical protein [Cytophagales bacterium]